MNMYTVTGLLWDLLLKYTHRNANERCISSLNLLVGILPVCPFLIEVNDFDLFGIQIASIFQLHLKMQNYTYFSGFAAQTCFTALFHLSSPNHEIVTGLGSVERSFFSVSFGFDEPAYLKKQNLFFVNK